MSVAHVSNQSDEIPALARANDVTTVPIPDTSLSLNQMLIAVLACREGDFSPDCHQTGPGQRDVLQRLSTGLYRRSSASHRK